MQISICSCPAQWSPSLPLVCYLPFKPQYSYLWKGELVIHITKLWVVQQFLSKCSFSSFLGPPLPTLWYWGLTPGHCLCLSGTLPLSASQFPSLLFVGISIPSLLCWYQCSSILLPTKPSSGHLPLEFCLESPPVSECMVSEEGSEMRTSHRLTSWSYHVVAVWALGRLHTHWWPNFLTTIISTSQVRVRIKWTTQKV